jgi:enoyl-CoA hydratase/carnithine racemase
MAGTVLYAEGGEGVRVVTLNRPHRLNAINAELLADLRAALGAAQSDAGVRAVVLAGAGRAFCSGDDLKDFGDQARGAAETKAYIEALQDVTRAIVLGDRPVIGAIHGWAVGGGLEWMIDCDLAVLAQGTRCFFPEVSLGMFVTGGASALLPRLVGLQKARELILFGERFDAAEALAMGLAWKVVPEAGVMPLALETARRIAALPERAVRDLKRVLNRALACDVEGALTLETEAAVQAFLDPATAAHVGRFKR